MPTDIVTYLSPLFIAIFILLCMCRFLLYGCCCCRHREPSTTTAATPEYISTSSYRERLARDLADQTRRCRSSNVRIQPTSTTADQRPSSVWTSTSRLPQYSNAGSPNLFAYFADMHPSDMIIMPSDHGIPPLPIPPPKYEDALRQCSRAPPPYSSAVDPEVGGDTTARRRPSLIERLFSNGRRRSSAVTNNVSESPPEYTPPATDSSISIISTPNALSSSATSAATTNNATSGNDEQCTTVVVASIESNR
jgi:hypothetical protein